MQGAYDRALASYKDIRKTRLGFGRSLRTYLDMDCILSIFVTKLLDIFFEREVINQHKSQNTNTFEIKFPSSGYSFICWCFVE